MSKKHTHAFLADFRFQFAGLLLTIGILALAITYMPNYINTNSLPTPTNLSTPTPQPEIQAEITQAPSQPTPSPATKQITNSTPTPLPQTTTVTDNYIGDTYSFEVLTVTNFTKPDEEQLHLSPTIRIKALYCNAPSKVCNKGAIRLAINTSEQNGVIENDPFSFTNDNIRAQTISEGETMAFPLGLWMPKTDEFDMVFYSQDNPSVKSSTHFITSQIYVPPSLQPQ